MRSAAPSRAKNRGRNRAYLAVPMVNNQYQQHTRSATARRTEDQEQTAKRSAPPPAEHICAQQLGDQLTQGHSRCPAALTLSRRRAFRHHDSVDDLEVGVRRGAVAHALALARVQRAPELGAARRLSVALPRHAVVARDRVLRPCRVCQVNECRAMPGAKVGRGEAEVHVHLEPAGIVPSVAYVPLKAISCPPWAGPPPHRRICCPTNGSGILPNASSVSGPCAGARR